MKEKMVLELLAKGRLSVEESAALLGFATEQDLPTQPKRRAKKHQRYFTKADHVRIIETFLQCGSQITETAKKLELSVQTVRNHLQYAGYATCPSQDAVNRVITWRKHRKMYLTLPTPVVNK